MALPDAVSREEWRAARVAPLARGEGDPSWDRGCSSCTAGADEHSAGLDAHLHARDTHPRPTSTPSRPRPPRTWPRRLAFTAVVATCEGAVIARASIVKSGIALRQAS